jgi:hypothetical protein
MLIDQIFDRFVENSPVAVMTRASLEYALEPDGIDAVFANYADRQYEKKLLFSTMLDITSRVVCGTHRSIHSAYKALKHDVPVSITAVYDKLCGVETTTTEALVAYSAEKLGPVIDSLGVVEPWVSGYVVRVLDGNHLAATERRLEVLRNCAAGPLPGEALVVIEPERGLVVQMVGCEDGHAQERSLLAPIIASARPKDLYIADRNFCTLGFLFGLKGKEASFAIRQHANLPIASSGTLRSRGHTDTGAVYEQRITLRYGEEEIKARRIVIRLDTPTRDGVTEMAVITNLPMAIHAIRVAELYRRRWTIETFFAHIERYLKSEIKSLGYPRAALFGFGVSLVAANTFSTVLAAMEAAKRQDPVVANMPISSFYVVEEARNVIPGLDIAVGPEVWERFWEMPATDFGALLVKWAKNAKWKRFRKAVRGAKKPPKKRTRFKNKPHVSTARLLEQQARKRS